MAGGADASESWTETEAGKEDEEYPEEVAEQIDDLPDSIEFTAAWHYNPQRHWLRTYHFKPRDRQCTGTIFLCHGYGVHTLFAWLLPTGPGQLHTKWKGSILESLTSAGFEVYTQDQQGHGRSEAARGLVAYFEDFDDLPKENIAYVKDAILENPRRQGPLFLLGISMGGATAVRMVQMEPELFKGLVLYAPMLSLEHIKNTLRSRGSPAAFPKGS
jgi:alpha-beta hydrolase superfamily lysophospholipase